MALQTGGKPICCSNADYPSLSHPWCCFRLGVGRGERICPFVHHCHWLISHKRHLCVYFWAIWTSLCCEMLVLILVPYLKISLVIIRSELLTTAAGQLLQLRKTNAFDKGNWRHRPPSSKGRESNPYWLVSITHLIKGTTYFQTLRVGAGAIHKTHIERSAFTKFALMFLRSIDPWGETIKIDTRINFERRLSLSRTGINANRPGAVREGKKQPLLH